MIMSSILQYEISDGLQIFSTLVLFTTLFVLTVPEDSWKHFDVIRAPLIISSIFSTVDSS